MKHRPIVDKVFSCPAYDVIKGRFNGDVLIVEAGDEFALAPDYLRHYKANSVISYALASDRDPIDSVQTAIKNHHELHWLSPISAVLTNRSELSHVPHHQLIELQINQVIRFQGINFRVERTYNDNLKLTRVQII